MGSRQKLGKRRPVTFHFKTDPRGGMRHGLIGQEVAKVYPELVARDDRMQIELTPMLLNEVQRQQQELQELKQQEAQLQELHGMTHGSGNYGDAARSRHSSLLRAECRLPAPLPLD
jgi:TolA-binding protein